MRLFDEQPPWQEYCENPYPWLNQLREESPLYFQAERNAWFVSGGQDVMELFADERLQIAAASSFADQSALFRNSMARSIRAFMAPPHAPELILAVERISADCVQRLLGSETADLRTELAQSIPFLVMAELLGIPPGDQPLLLKLLLPILEQYDLSWPGRSQSSPLARHFLVAYFREHLIAARTKQTTPLMRLLLDQQQAHALPEDSMLDACIKLLTGGVTTTAGCIGNVMARLLRPGYATEFERGVADAGWDHAVTECLRLDTAVMAVKREVKDGFTFRGMNFESGQRLYLMVASANRDPALFASDGEIDWSKKGKSHLSFGKGSYYCPGSPLARLELESVLKNVLPVLPRLCLREPIAWQQGWIVHEPRRIPVLIKEQYDVFSRV